MGCGGAGVGTFQAVNAAPESLRILFDSTVTSYEHLLEHMFSIHTPSRATFGTQYRSCIWFHDEAQRNAAEASVNALGEPRRDFVLIEEAGFFSPAPDGTQHYLDRSGQ